MAIVERSDDYEAAPRPCAVTVAMLCALADDIDLYVWQNVDVDTGNLLKTISECCQEAGLWVGEC